MDVPRNFYRSVQTGDSINIFLKQGRLGIPWYFIVQKQTALPPMAPAQ